MNEDFSPTKQKTKWENERPSLEKSLETKLLVKLLNMTNIYLIVFSFAFYICFDLLNMTNWSLAVPIWKIEKKRVFCFKNAFSCAYFQYKHMRMQQYTRKREKLRKSEYLVLPTTPRRLFVLNNKQQITKAHTRTNKTI